MRLRVNKKRYSHSKPRCQKNEHLNLSSTHHARPDCLAYSYSRNAACSVVGTRIFHADEWMSKGKQPLTQGFSWASVGILRKDPALKNGVFFESKF